MGNKSKFYDSIWFMWFTLIFFAPVGIWIMWRNNRFNNIIRILLSVFFTLMFIGAIVSNGKSSNTIKTQSNSQENINEKAKAEAETKAESEAKAKAEVQAKANTEAKAKAESEVKANTEAEAKADVKVKADAKTVVVDNSQKINIREEDYVKILRDFPKIGDGINQMPSYMSLTFKITKDYKKVEYFDGEYNNIKIAAETIDGMLMLLTLDVKNENNASLPAFTSVTEYLYNKYGEPKNYLPDNGFTLWALSNNDKDFISFSPKSGNIIGKMEN